MTLEVVHHFIKKKLLLHNVSIHRKFYENQFINEYARKLISRSLHLQSQGITVSVFLLDVEEKTFLRIKLMGFKLTKWKLNVSK